MDIETLQLTDAQLERIHRDAESLTLTFSRLYLFREMDGAYQDTKWKQAADFVLQNPVIEGELPECPCVLDGADVIDDIYTYRDLVKLPMDSRGDVGVVLRVQGADTPVRITGDRLQVLTLGHARYVGHVDKDAW